LGEHVTITTGTGAVHTAPGHGLEDYQVGLRYNLPVYNPVGPDGKFVASTPLFAGLHVFTANTKVIEELQVRGCLVHSSRLCHSYPHCWRHKSPIIFRATPQWFISFEQNDLRATALREIEYVHWMPEWGKARIHDMVAERPEWCISRQRTWGLPIPLFVHKETGKLHPDTQSLLEQVAVRVEEHGIQAWFDLKPEELLGVVAPLYEKSHDTLDVWFDSGVTHACVLEMHKELQAPADVYLEGTDQYRGWFQSSLMTAVAMYGRAPYRQVLTHGFVIDENKVKMSKSEGNLVTPQQIWNNLGAEIIRLWTASADYRTGMALSDEIFIRVTDVYRRIRNTARFLLANLEGFDPELNQISPDSMLALDNWVVDRTYHLQQEIIKAYQEYQFHNVVHKIHNFCTNDLGSFYLGIIKDRQYVTQWDSLPRRSAQTAMYHVIEALTRWLAPILSFTADEIWSYIPGVRSDSVFLEAWYTKLTPLDASSPFTPKVWEQIFQVRQEVSKHLEQARKAGTIGSSLDAEVDLYVDKNMLDCLLGFGDELRFVLVTSYARVHPLEVSGNEAAATDLAGLRLLVAPSQHAKCARCWHHREDVGTNSEHPQLCARCIDNLTQGGETRLYA
ncbi:isoleucine--tRNA ligase, partial [Achromatium sp. WMS2]